MKIAKLLPLCLLLLLVASCENPFRPRMWDRSSNEVYNRDPIELLQNLVKAYSEKNTKIFKSLLHPEYRFELLQSEYNSIGIDMDGDGIKDSWWGYDEEIELHKNMFEGGSSDGLYPSPDKIEIKLQIPPQELWEKDPADGREDWLVIPCFFNLSVVYHDTNSSYIASGVARFYLVQEGGRWYIRIWRDESLL
ncbi:MAG: hypothetical protein PHC50_02930 [Candidatus Cloacimonetes bacterium]|nr:hypothetical protein [Candidatus Cloacimonadota bacterium]